MDEDLSSKKKTVGTHTSYMSCCLFPGSDNQVLTGSGDATCALWWEIQKYLFRFLYQTFKLPLNIQNQFMVKIMLSTLMSFQATLVFLNCIATNIIRMWLLTKFTYSIYENIHLQLLLHMKLRFLIYLLSHHWFHKFFFNKNAMNHWTCKALLLEVNQVIKLQKIFSVKMSSKKWDQL